MRLPLRARVLALLFLAPGPAAAGSTDLTIFSSGTAPPNIAIVIDDSGSMGSSPNYCADSPPPGTDCRAKWEIARDAAITLIQETNPPDGAGGFVQNARFGLFLFDDDENGAMLMAPIADDNTANVLAQAALIDKDGGTPLGTALVDVGRYFAGAALWGTLPRFGTLPYQGTLPDPTHEQNVPSPMDLECRHSFVIAMSDGEGDTSTGAKYPNSALWATIGDADGDGEESQNSSEEWFDDAAWAMYRKDFQPGVPGTQNIRVHTVAFDLGGAGATLLQNAASYGGGSYHEANGETSLAEAFTAATGVIMDSVASFTSAVVNASRSGGSDIFLNAWFEPRTGQPVWAGHLEAYRLAPSGVVLDASGSPAIDPATDLLIEPHDPFWDAGEVLKANAARTLYTTDGGVRVPFASATASITNAELDIEDPDELASYPNHPDSGVDTVAELRVALFDFLHGRDAFDEDDDSDAGELRDVVLGDIFHSMPALIGAPRRLFVHEDGYLAFRGAYQNRDRVVYAGANDGMLHAFDAGSFHAGDDPGTPETEHGYYDLGSGAERFGYVPGLLLDRVKLVPRNSPRVAYFVDGSPIAAEAWLGDGSGSDTTKSAEEWATVLVTGLREGGSGYLALDITDPDALAGDPHGPYPRLLWEFDHARLAESWSEPVITRLKVRGAAGSGDHCGPDDGDGDCREQWVALVAGGYRPDGDPNHGSYAPLPAHPNWSDRGKALFAVALDSGAVLASVEYDVTGLSGPSEMVYALPSSPAVLDLDFDGFADVVYVGDLGGQVWKWDLAAVGEDTAGDARIDNWPAGVFFRADPASMGIGVSHYRSFFFPPAASFLHGRLLLAFGSGEREQLRYPGDPGRDDNNRFYIVADPFPIGPSAFSTLLTEADLTDVTSFDVDFDASDSGYFFRVGEGEKFVTDATVFAGYVIAASYTPTQSADPCAPDSGQGFLYVLKLSSGLGFFADDAAPPSEDRRSLIGTGFPSRPRVTISRRPEDDAIWVKTSDGRIRSVTPPTRTDPPVSMIYWRQRF